MTAMPEQVPAMQAQFAAAPTRSPEAWPAARVRLWIGSTAALGLMLLALLGAALAQPSQIDLFIRLNQGAMRWPAALWSALTLMGDTAVLLALLSPLLLWRTQAWLAMLASAPLGGLYSFVLKRLVDWPRPAAVLDAAQVNLIGPALQQHSFPSGHTITAFAAASALLCTLLAAARPWQQGCAFAAALGMASAVAFSRVAVGAHWPIDLLAGAAGGWLAGLSGAWLAARGWQAGTVGWSKPAGRMSAGAIMLALAVVLLGRQEDYPQGAALVLLAAGASAAVGLALMVRRRT